MLWVVEDVWNKGDFSLAAQMFSPGTGNPSSNTSNPQGSLTSSTFGYVTGTLGSGTGVNGTGGGRAVQLGVKVSF